MKKEDFDELSYASRKEIVELRKWSKKVADENDEIIYEREADGVLHEFIDNTNKFAFNIAFSKPNEAAGGNYYRVYYRPLGLTSNEGGHSQQNFEGIRNSFVSWLSYIKQLHEITDEYYNPNGRFYDKEFKDFFTNSDPDATTSPYDLERQELLHYFLTYAEIQILSANELADETKEELKQEIGTLKTKIPDLTKKETVKSLSKIAQKIKKHSNNLFHLIFDVLKKEAVKKALEKGLEYLPNAVDTVKGWITLLI